MSLSRCPKVFRNLFDGLQLLRRQPNSTIRLAALQERLLVAIARREANIRRLRDALAEQKRRLGAIDGVRLTKNQAANAKNLVLNITYRIQAHQHFLFALRSIGDGIAFIYLDKWDIKAWARKERSGFLSGKHGLRLELKILRGALKIGAVAILTDLTNCLRHGDVVVVKNKIPLLLECKTGKRKNERAVRQEKNAQDMLDYLRDGVGFDPERPEWKVHRVELPLSERHHRRTALNSLQRAASAGYDIVWPEAGLCYVAVKGWMPQVVLEQSMRHFVSPPLAFITFPSQVPAYFYPCTLLLNDAEIAWNVYMGELTFVVLIAPEVIKSSLDRAGRITTFLREDDWLLELHDPGNPEVGPMRVSRQFLARVAYEFLNLNRFLEQIDKMVSAGPDLTKA